MTLILSYTQRKTNQQEDIINMKDTKFSGTNKSPNSKPKQDDVFICPNENNQKYDHNVNETFEFCKPTCDEITYNEDIAMNVLNHHFLCRSMFVTN
jgi:hypothetical protein